MTLRLPPLNSQASEIGKGQLDQGTKKLLLRDEKKLKKVRPSPRDSQHMSRFIVAYTQREATTAHKEQIVSRRASRRELREEKKKQKQTASSEESMYSYEADSVEE